MRPGGRLIVALDVPTLTEAEHLVRELLPVVSLFKVGMQLFYAYGPQVVERIAAWGGQVFLDLKLHDIPNTVAEATRSLTRLGVSMLTVHAAGGREMLRQAVWAAREEAALQGLRPPLLLAVTVLTSLGRSELEDLGLGGAPRELVLRWAGLALEAGAAGVVASGREVKALRLAFGPEAVLVTPGIRPGWSAADDQKRTVTPREAVQAGATYLVVGRPIIHSPDPATAARRLLAEIEEGGE